jgi:hypothetical protein
MSEPKKEQVADPLIDEVRAVRRAVSEEVGHDVDRLAARLREVEKQYASRVVSPAAPSSGPQPSK